MLLLCIVWRRQVKSKIPLYMQKIPLQFQIKNYSIDTSICWCRQYYDQIWTKYMDSSSKNRAEQYHRRLWMKATRTMVSCAIVFSGISKVITDWIVFHRRQEKLNRMKLFEKMGMSQPFIVTCVFVIICVFIFVKIFFF